MIHNHIKTSWRSIRRSKLFSGINIVGLSVGMSVGLLLIAFIHDLLSYDRFHAKGSRVYRVVSQATFRRGERNDFASTSLRAGQLIREKVSGIETMAVLRTEFSGDATVNDRVVPLKGYYTEPTLFDIFTLPMSKGDPATALREPNSIVLTESTSKKLFGTDEAFGKTIQVGAKDYLITGILEDIPFFSHLQFESLVSWSTVEPGVLQDPQSTAWWQVWQRHYVYVLLPDNVRPQDVQNQLNTLSAQENRASKEGQVQLRLQPLHDIVLGETKDNAVGPVVPRAVVWGLTGLALVVILSACFNYTNLSLARSIRRYKEIGVRKVMGAGSRNVQQQFLVEAIIVAVAAWVLSFVLFLALRTPFLGIAPELTKIVKLEITGTLLIFFAAFAVFVGLLAGLLPATLLGKVQTLQALKDASTVRVFKGMTLRKILVVVQYTVTLIFMTSTVIGYVQYKDILSFDLGFSTHNVLNINLQKNKPEELINKLRALPEVADVSQSRLLTSVGNAWGGFVKYKTLRDSSLVLLNIVDEHYLPLHRYQLVAGQNFVARPLTKEATSEIIVSEKALRQLGIAGGDAQKAIGEELLFNNKPLTVVGVIKDFHYGKLDSQIDPVVFTYLTPDAFLTRDSRDGLVNVLLNTSNPTEVLAKIEEVWKSVDPVHPFQAQFYDDAIEEAYQELSATLQVIGFLSVLAISIASLGLLGMVVYTTETRLREISIRKVLGASSASIVLLLSGGFALLLAISAVLALPVTWYIFEKVLLTRFPFHKPVGAVELMTGLFGVLVIATVAIGSQTWGAAQRNPSEVLKRE